jgi:hypothetical protein
MVVWDVLDLDWDTYTVGFLFLVWTYITTASTADTKVQRTKNVNQDGRKLINHHHL